SVVHPSFSVDTLTTLLYALSLHDALPISFGIDGLGARGEEDADFPTLSRQGADADFQKLEVAARWDQAIREHLAYSLYGRAQTRSEEHTSELQSRENLVCRLLLEKKK